MRAAVSRSFCATGPLVDCVLDHLHGDDLALLLVYGLAPDAGGKRLVEFLHEEVAEVDDVLRPAALIARLTLLPRLEVREPARLAC